jgi:phospholipid/cholesterol/gamma-HCH transport system substrate-binding protein
MLLERNQAVIGVVVSLLLLAGTAFAVGASGGMFKPGDQLSAEFTDAAGLKPGDFVWVAGIRTGEVLDVEIDGQIARARFTLQADGIPADSTASIIISGTLGKRALRIEPGTSDDYLGADDVIPVERTSTPVDLPELGDRSAELLGGVNVDALQDLVTAVADTTDGNREDVARLLDGLDQVTEIITDEKEDLGLLIDRAEVVIDAAAAKDQQIVTIIDEFGSTLNRLAARRTEVQTLLSETALTSEITADLVGERRAQLDRILFELNQDLAIIDAHQVDLAHTLAYAGVGVRGFSSIGYAGGPAQADTTGWGNVFVTGLGQAGIQALLGCNSPVDEALTQLIGPDPQCEGTGAVSDQMEDTNSHPGDADEDHQGPLPELPVDPPSLYRGFDEFFRAPGTEEVTP